MVEIPPLPPGDPTFHLAMESPQLYMMNRLTEIPSCHMEMDQKPIPYFGGGKIHKSQLLCSWVFFMFFPDYPVVHFSRPQGHPFRQWEKAAKAGVGENCRAGPSPWDFVVPVAYSQVPNSLWESNMTMESHRIAYDSRQIGCSSSRFRKMCLEIWREVLGQTRVGQTQPTRTGWWFGTMEFYDFPYIGNNTPIWLFFRGVETTNQRMFFFSVFLFWLETLLHYIYDHETLVWCDVQLFTIVQRDQPFLAPSFFWLDWCRANAFSAIQTWRFALCLPCYH